MYPIETRFSGGPAPLRGPKHLRLATRRWWVTVVQDYQLEPHHIRLLTLAGEAWDRCQQAREALVPRVTKTVVDGKTIDVIDGGLTFLDRFGQPHARPEVAIERDSRVAFARLLRELALDVEPPGEPGRPPGLGG